METSTQLSLFGDHITFVVERGTKAFALGAGMATCAEGWCHGRLVNLTPYADWEDVMWGIEGSTFVCDSCDTMRCHCESSQCSNCDSCSECCECAFCESCEEHVSDYRICERCLRNGETICSSCCDAETCDNCGEHSEYLECGCDDDCDEPRRSNTADIVSVMQYNGEGWRIGRTFGIEIEVANLSTTYAAACLTAANLSASAQGYNHCDSETEWKVTTDASVPNGCEVVSPIMAGSNGIAQLQTAVTALVANGAGWSRDTGIHVHVDAGDLSYSQCLDVAAFYAANTDVLDSFYCETRKGNSYCQTIRSDYVEYLRGIATHGSEDERKHDLSYRAERYLAVNLQALRAHGTIEFRAMEGNGNVARLTQWCRVLTAIVDGIYRGELACDKVFATKEEMLSFLGIDAVLV